MQKVLVTGANGFVGQHLVAELKNNGVDVIGVGGPTEREDLASDYLVLDLTEASDVQKIDFSGVSGVIHLAGLAAVGPSFEEPMRYLTTNVGIEVNLFEAALAQNIQPRFLIISSGSLYDPAAELPLTEASLVLPSSPYAVSKLGQEQMASYYTRRGFEAVIARPFNHIGPGQGPGFIMPDIVKQLVECEQGKRDEIIVGNLDAKRDYTDVRDIVRAYRLLLEKGVTSETYNVCSGKALSGHEILDGILAEANVKPNVTQDPSKMRPADNPVNYGDHAKLTQITGWEPKIPLEKTLADVVADWRSR